jgi:hypothetical protein
MQLRTGLSEQIGVVMEKRNLPQRRQGRKEKLKKDFFLLAIFAHLHTHGAPEGVPARSVTLREVIFFVLGVLCAIATFVFELKTNRNEWCWSLADIVIFDVKVLGEKRSRRGAEVADPLRLPHFDLRPGRHLRPGRPSAKMGERKKTGQFVGVKVERLGATGPPG